jgi:hypothetical protein
VQFYTIGIDGHFVGYKPLICADDVEAIAKAERLVDGHDVELWSGERFVLRPSQKNEIDNAGFFLWCSNFDSAIRPSPVGRLKKERPMTDQWNEDLCCPRCRNTGTARLSQCTDADIPIVENVSDGFEAVKTEYGPNFHCRICDVPVMP